MAAANSVLAICAPGALVLLCPADREQVSKGVRNQVKTIAGASFALDSELKRGDTH